VPISPPPKRSKRGGLPDTNAFDFGRGFEPDNHDRTGALVSALGVQLLEALHDSAEVQKHSPELLEAVEQALELSRARTPPPSQIRQSNRVPIGSLTLLEFTSDGLPKRTPASPRLRLLEQSRGCHCMELREIIKNQISEIHSTSEVDLLENITSQISKIGNISESEVTAITKLLDVKAINEVKTCITSACENCTQSASVCRPGWCAGLSFVA
jgi:hypothetical protein